MDITNNVQDRKNKGKLGNWHSFGKPSYTFGIPLANLEGLPKVETQYASIHILY
jgi:hypothetical protein